MDPAPGEGMTDATTPRFSHHRLDAYQVALEALVQGDRIARGLPRGYGKLKDQLQRALQGAFLQTVEAASRTGADRRSRFCCARAEATEAAAALEALDALGLAPTEGVHRVNHLLFRLVSMLTKLAR
ncbi:MAG: four helix bundle protein, partial [Myxococcota bacterium]